eukprot:1151817-Pelagomonas_calceolata.AAC.2
MVSHFTKSIFWGVQGAGAEVQKIAQFWQGTAETYAKGTGAYMLQLNCPCRQVQLGEQFLFVIEVKAWYPALIWIRDALQDMPDALCLIKDIISLSFIIYHMRNLASLWLVKIS